MRRRRITGAKAAGRARRLGLIRGSPLGFRDMVEGKRKAACGFLGVGAFRQGRAAATVKLPEKLINRNPPPGALD